MQILEFLENDAYDKLLTENIVFIKLVDASAVNTLLECIVRNTPIVVNPLPAVIEYLGENYPLYYTNIGEAAVLLNDKKKLLAGHKYLRKLDKEELKLDVFIQKVITEYN